MDYLSKKNGRKYKRAAHHVNLFKACRLKVGAAVVHCATF